jgi:hypothetical protein
MSKVPIPKTRLPWQKMSIFPKKGYKNENTPCIILFGNIRRRGNFCHPNSGKG